MISNIIIPYLLMPAEPVSLAGFRLFLEVLMYTPLRLMCILAHPDDESLGTGSTLARYCTEGDRNLPLWTQPGI